MLTTLTLRHGGSCSMKDNQGIVWPKRQLLTFVLPWEECDQKVLSVLQDNRKHLENLTSLTSALGHTWIMLRISKVIPFLYRLMMWLGIICVDLSLLLQLLIMIRVQPELLLTTGLTEQTGKVFILTNTQDAACVDSHAGNQHRASSANFSLCLPLSLFSSSSLFSSLSPPWWERPASSFPELRGAEGGYK